MKIQGSKIAQNSNAVPSISSASAQKKEKENLSTDNTASKVDTVSQITSTQANTSRIPATQVEAESPRGADLETETVHSFNTGMLANVQHEPPHQ